MNEKTKIKSKAGAAIEIKEAPVGYELLLPEEEKILWSGQPDPKKFAFVDVFRVTLGLLVTVPIVALLVVVLVALPAAKPEVTPIAEKLGLGAFYFLLLLPFAWVGVEIARFPFLEIERKKRTHFYVTNKRAFAKCDGKKKQTEHSLDLLKTVKTTVLPGKNACGTIVFDELPTDMKDQLAFYQPKDIVLLKNTLVFFDVSNVDEVDKTIKTVVAESTCESVMTVDRTDDAKRKRILPGLFTSIYQFRLRYLLMIGALLIVALAPMCYLIGSQTKLFGFVDKSGKFIVKPAFGEAGHFSEGLASASMPLSNAMGYVDKSGKFAIKPKFTAAAPFSDGLAAVAINSNKDGPTKYGYIDHSGNLVIPPTFDRAMAFCGGLAAAMLNGQKGEYDESWGLIDKKGRWRIKPKFLEIGKFVNGIAPASMRDKEDPNVIHVFLIDENGKIVQKLNQGIDLGWPGSPNGFSEGLIPAARYDSYKCGYLDTQGKFVIAPQFEQAKGFSEGLAPACVQEKWGYIDKKGAWVVKPQFTSAEEFRMGRAAVEVGLCWGYIDRQGKMVIKPVYKEAQEFHESLARVTVKYGEEQLIDRAGNVVAKGKSCGDMHEGLAPVAH